MEAHPTHLNIEITTKCTAGCYICPRKVIARKNKDMAIEDILDIVAQGYEMGVRQVGLHLFGEPTMHPQYANILYQIRNMYPDIILRGYTNGYGLSNEEIRKSILDNMDNLVISIDGATDETMLKNRPGINPQLLEESVKKLVEENKKRIVDMYGEEEGNASKTKIIIRMTLTDDCEEEKLPFIEKWKPYVGNPGTGIAFAKLSNYKGDDSIERVPVREAILCDRIFFHVVVSVEKDVLLCCEDALPSCVLGNLKYNSLSEIWFGEKMEEIRKLHLDDKSYKVPLCQVCTYNPGWKFNYSPYIIGEPDTLDD